MGSPDDDVLWLNCVRVVGWGYCSLKNHAGLCVPLCTLLTGCFKTMALMGLPVLTVLSKSGGGGDH